MTAEGNFPKSSAAQTLEEGIAVPFPRPARDLQPDPQQTDRRQKTVAGTRNLPKPLVAHTYPEILYKILAANLQW